MGITRQGINVAAARADMIVNTRHGFETDVRIVDFADLDLTGSEMWEGDVRTGQSFDDPRPGGVATQFLTVTSVVDGDDLVLTISMTDANAEELDTDGEYFYTVGVVGDRAILAGRVVVQWSVLS